MQNLTNYQEASRKGSEHVLSVVIKSLTSIFPAWRGAIKTQADLDGVRREWLTAFIDNNIKTDTQIQRGLQRARTETTPFFPSVGQFIEWCKPQHASHKRYKGLEYKTEKVPASRIEELKAMSQEELKKVIHP